MTFADCLVTYLSACLQGMSHPHDVTVDSANHMVYVGELNPPKVWQFQMDPALYTGIQWTYMSPASRNILAIISLETSVCFSLAIPRR